MLRNIQRLWPWTSGKSQRPRFPKDVRRLRKRIGIEELEDRRLLTLVPPVLHSLPGAPATFYLDFVGSPAFAWNGTIAHGPGSTSAPIPAFHIDGDGSTFSATERSTIQNIWTIASEKLSPFDIDVTTVDPGNRTNGVTLTDIIGGSNSDWYGGGSGVSVVGSFTNTSQLPIVFCWWNDFNYAAQPTYATDFAGGYVIPHEAGHAFGLNHERSLPSPNTITYYTGDGTRAPIMGVDVTNPPSAQRGIWWLTNMEPGQQSPDPIQDEIYTIANYPNTFGFRPDDHSYSNYVTLNANPDGSIGPGYGVIEKTSDVDPFRFTAIAPSGVFNISSTLTAAGGGMLSPTGRLIDAANNSPISYSVSTNGTLATLSTNAMIPGHDYYIEVDSYGRYGDIGQYKVWGSPQGFAALNGNTLNIFGYGDSPNNITISRTGGVYTLTDTLFGATATQTFNASQVVIINVSLGAGDDQLEYGTGDLSLLAPATAINLGGGADSLIVDDSDYIPSASYGVYDTQIGRTGGLQGQALFDSSVESVVLYPGTALNNVVHVYSTRAMTSVQSSNTSIVDVGDNGSIQGLQGTLYVTNPPAHSALNIDDSADPNARHGFLSSGVLSGLSPASIYWTPNDISSVIISGGTGGNIFDVASTTAGLPTTINAGSGHDTVNVGTPGSLLDGVTNLTVSGGAATTLNLNDQLNSYGRFDGRYVWNPLSTTYQVTKGNVSRNNVVQAIDVVFGGAQVITYISSINYSHLAALTINGGSAHNDFNVQSTAPATPTTINAGAANDVVNAGATSNLLDDINSLTVNGAAGTTLYLDDQSNTFGRVAGLYTLIPQSTSYLVTNGNIARTDIVLGLYALGGAQVFSYNTSVSYSNLAALVINGGGTPNVYSVRSTASGTPTTINAGATNDTVTVGNAANSLSDIQGALDLDGQAGTNYLTFNDQGATGSPTHVLTSNSLTRSGAAPMTFRNFIVQLNQGSSVIGTNLFYKNSTAWNVTNSNLPGASDDNAIASDKTAYLPGSGNATFAAVSSYTRGINGLMVDMAGAHGTLTANDFTFKIGNNNSPGLWAAAIAPTSVTTRSGAGVSGSDRVELTWADNAIQKAWLEVIVKGNDALGGFDTNSGLASSYVFYFGNALGDSGAADATSFMVSSADEQSARNDPHGPGNRAAIVNANDFNRDGLVNSTDQQTARNYATNPVSALAFLNIGAGGPFDPVEESEETQANDAPTYLGDRGIATALAIAGAQPVTQAIVSQPSSLILSQPSVASEASDGGAEVDRWRRR